MDRHLVYDVGMHNGDDTACYLRQGYRVVAIEADPMQAEAGRRRFAEEIADCRVTIVEAAIGKEHGRASFWISSNPEYSSFDRENAEKWNNTSREVEVVCRTMQSIFSEFGTPYYLKIDIEGADRFCLEAINPEDAPEFVSFEKGGGLENLLLMQSRGYSRFKMIAQEDFSQLNFHPGRDRLLASRLANWRKRANRLFRRGTAAPDAAACYAYGSSGPFGEATDGPWRSMEQVAFTWLAFDLGHTGDPDPAWNDWFDVHCGR